MKKIDEKIGLKEHSVLPMFIRLSRFKKMDKKKAHGILSSKDTHQTKVYFRKKFYKQIQIISKK